MSCFVEKQFHPNGSEYFQLFDDPTYNGILNGLVWNVIFTAVVTPIAYLLWTRSEIPFLEFILLKCRFFVRGEDIDSRNITEERQERPPFWIFLEKWFWFDKEFLRKNSEPMAYHYVSFQRHLLLFCLFWTVLVCIVILPVNAYVGAQYGTETFAATTMSNIDANHSDVFWLHIFFALSFGMSMVLLMQRFSRDLDLRVGSEEYRIEKTNSKTVFLSALEPGLRTEATIRAMLEDYFPNVNIVNIRLNLRMSSTSKLEDEYLLIEEIIRKCDENTYLFNTACCCFKSPGENKLALPYYESKKRESQVLLRRKVEDILKKKSILDSAFVQFRTNSEARAVVLFYQNVINDIEDFYLDFAPPLHDILWSRMTFGLLQWIETFFAELVWFSMLLLLINADRLASIIENWIYHEPGDNRFTNFLDSSKFLRSGWNVFVTSIWNRMAAWIWKLNYWTQSDQARGFMLRQFWMYFFSLYLIPILNVDSFFQVIKNLIIEGTFNIQWECLFLADNGAHYITTIIVFTFVGLPIELMRSRPLLRQIWAYLKSKSQPERDARSIDAAFVEFECDSEMADTLIIFTITVCNMIMSPLVGVAGLVYMFAKQGIDSYFLLGKIYKTPKFNPRPFFLSAVNLLTFVCFLTLLNVISCIFLCPEGKEHFSDAAAMYSPILIVVYVVVITQQLQMDQTWPIKIVPPEPVEEPEPDTTPDPLYEPEVFRWRYFQPDLSEN